MDEVRQMLSELAVQEARSGGSAAADPKRALMVSLANAVLRQPAPPTASQQPQQQPALLQQAFPLPDEWRQQQQQVAEALASLEQRQERQQQQVAEALGQQQQWQQQQHRQMAEALSRLEQRQERQHRQTVEAVHRLEQRVAAVESLCHDMHGMLRQLVAQQQRAKQPMMAGITGLGVM